MSLVRSQAMRFERTLEPPIIVFGLKHKCLPSPRLIVESSDNLVFLPKIVGFDMEIANIDSLCHHFLRLR